MPTVSISLFGAGMPRWATVFGFMIAALLVAVPARAQDGPRPPGLEFAFEVRVEVADPTVIGKVHGRERRIVNILGGTFEGPGIHGKVLPGGADWQLIGAGGFTNIDARYTLETSDGDLIYVSNIGIRHASEETMQRLNSGEKVDPSLVYFRAIPTFETSAPSLDWLTRSIFISAGERYPNGVIIRFWRVL